jgi:DNA-binding response OmpR family regulator
VGRIYTATLFLAQAGSQDYICKPFQPQEVLARIETQLRLYMGEMQQLQVGINDGGKEWHTTRAWASCSVEHVVSLYLTHYS